MRRIHLVIVFLLVLACAAESPEPPIEFCKSSVRQLYDPDGFDLFAWPDDALAVAADTSTGIRLTAEMPWLESIPPLIQDMLATIEGPSGFARQGAAVLRFSHDVGLSDGIWDEPTLHDPLLFLAWPEGEPELVPFELAVDEDGTQLRLQPLRPLRPAAPHAVLLRSSHLAADGRCVAPPRLIRQALTEGPPRPELARVANQLEEALVALGWRADDISAAISFTTHDDVALVGRIARALHEQAPPTWASRPQCEASRDFRVCIGTFVATDFRTNGAVENETPQDTYEVPVTIWLPEKGDTPAPLVMFGHGLSSSRSEGRSAARRLAPDGLAVVSVDALMHGEHPTSAGDDMSGFDFLGISLAGPSIDGRALRGNFIQTALDRLQIMLLLLSDPDVDGDGEPDLDTERFGYWGVSLGALIGSIQLAISDHLDAAVLTLAGGHLIEFATGGEVSSLIQDLLRELLDGDEAALQLLLAVTQSMADPADPAVFGAHVRTERIVGEHPPHVLMPVALYDEIVPPATGRAVARAFALPHAEPIHDPVALLPPAGPLPLAANAGDRTAAFVQIDTVGDPPEPARHANTAGASEVREMSRHFFNTWVDTGVAEIQPLR